jgi:hypothetical protein
MCRMRMMRMAMMMMRTVRTMKKWVKMTMKMMRTRMMTRTTRSVLCMFWLLFPLSLFCSRKKHLLASSHTAAKVALPVVLTEFCAFVFAGAAV